MFDFARFSDSSEISGFAVVDMDSDQVPEVIPEIADFENYPESYIVLHYYNGTVYGFDFGIRAMEDLKADGTFGWSDGADDCGYGKLRFSADEYDYDDTIAYCKSRNDSNGISTECYYINDIPVSELKYSTFSYMQDKKQDMVWFSFTPQSIDKHLLIS